MDHLTCDRCGNGLLLDAPVRYEVRIEVKSAYDPLELTREDLDRAGTNLREAIDLLKDYPADKAQAGGPENPWCTGRRSELR